MNAVGGRIRREERDRERKGREREKGERERGRELDWPLDKSSMNRFSLNSDRRLVVLVVVARCRSSSTPTLPERRGS